MNDTRRAPTPTALDEEAAEPRDETLLEAPDADDEPTLGKVTPVLGPADDVVVWTSGIPEFVVHVEVLVDHPPILFEPPSVDPAIRADGQLLVRYCLPSRPS